MAAADSKLRSPNVICPSVSCLVYYTGYVYDQEGYGISGVVVVLQANCAGYGSASGSTNGVGYWSIGVPTGCSYNAYFYWQSQSSGPLLLQVNNVPQSSSYTLTVWEQSINYNILYEYPNSANSYVQVQMSTTSSYTIEVSVDASISGGIADGFLQLTADLKLGTNLQVQETSGYSQSTNQPYVVFYPTGTAIKVQDVNGNSLNYVQYWTMSSFQSGNTNEWQSMSNAITIDTQKGTNPYVQVAGCASPCPNPSTETYSISLSTKLTVSASVGVDFRVAWGTFDLTTTFSFSSSTGTTLSETLTLYNSQSSDACYVVYYEGSNQNGGSVDIHAWFYQQSACP